MASVKTSKFVRKSFPVDAIQVTPENIKEIAEWCAGEIRHDGDKEGHLSRDYIKVRVAYPKDERQTQAFLGDWVLRSGKSFKVYTNSAFEKSFDPAEPKQPAAKKQMQNKNQKKNSTPHHKGAKPGPPPNQKGDQQEKPEKENVQA